MPTSIRHLKLIFKKDSKPIVLFSKWQGDNLYYIVKLVKLDEKKDRCLVRYEDGLDCWTERKDLHLQFNTSVYPYNESDDIFCCLCDGEKSDPPNEVILCDTCQQGFHQTCHEPNIRQVDIENDTQEWTCQTCAYILSQLDPIPKTSTPRVKSRSKKNPPRPIAAASAEPAAKSAPTEPAAKSAPTELAAKSAPTELAAKSVPTESATVSVPIEPAAKQAEQDVEPSNNNVGTSDFVDALVENRAKIKLTNRKGAKKAVLKKSSKIPAPA